MESSTRESKLLAIAVLIAALVTTLGCPAQNLAQHTLLGRVKALEEALEAAQADLAEAQAKLAHVSVEEESINGLNGPHLIIEGCNVHVRSGSGDTEDSAGLTGLGNLIVGYNEQTPIVTHGRLGSHNLVVGEFHEYPNYGGFVAGIRNAVTGAAASVSGGILNTASNDASSVSGGTTNIASGLTSSVSGGSANEASGTNSSASGGQLNTAAGTYASVSGGSGNTANGSQSCVSGGENRTASNENDWVAGSLFEDF